MDSEKFSLRPAVLKRPTGKETGPRRFQGIPGVETAGERLFVSHYANDIPGEGPGNYAVLLVGNDGGRSWKEVLHILPPDPGSRVYDPVLWRDPDGCLWLFWAQCRSEKLWDCFDGRAGVWAAVCRDPAASILRWSAPRRLADGVMMNKPEVLQDGSWALPAALWSNYPEKLTAEQKPFARSNLLITRDRGRTFTLTSGPDIAGRTFDEHVIVQQLDGSLRVLARTKYGVGESFSRDNGKTWSPARDSGLGGPGSRFALRRLRSGRLCLVNHQSHRLLPGEPPPENQAREKLTVWLSDDDGKSWYGRLLLDGRKNVAYPDISEGNDGFIYEVHDHERLVHGQIALSRFTEKDVAAGELVTPGSFTLLTVSSMKGMKHEV